MLRWTFVLLFSVIVVGQQEQKIETVLLSKWSPTSILSEAAEYISEVDSGLFWRFVENVLEKQAVLPMPDNDEGETDLASICAFNLLSSSNLRLMEWALSSRAYSPRVLLLHAMRPPVPEGCDSFVHLGGDKSSCSLDEIKRILESDKLQANSATTIVSDVDHKYPSFIWAEETQHIVVLYGHLTSPTTKILHEYLKSQADRVGYIFRPLGKESKEKLALSGYGVELQFKSTEYVAQDDSGKAEDERQEIGGFVFDKLHALHPDLTDKLDKFQNHLASIRGKKAEFEALKAWQVQELGLQASHFTTLQENFIEALLDVSGNFPSKASSLSSIRVPNEFKKSVTFNQRLLQSHFNIDEGEGAFFLQGSFLDPDSMDLFAFQETLKSEVDLIELLKSTNHDKSKTRADIDAILSMGSKSNSDPDLALDLRDASVVWVNDLEKDEEYEDWPDDLSQLFFRMGGVMLRPVRRNVFNLLLTLNPDDDATTGAMVKLAQSFMAHKAPVRIGVVFCNNADTEMTNSIEEEPRSDVIRRILNYAVAEGETKKIFDSIVDAYSKKDFSSLQALYIKAGEEYDFGKELSCDFVKKSGRPMPGAFLNGVPLKWDSVDDFEEIVLNQLLREAQTVQIDAFNGRVGDDTDIFEYLMSKPHVQTRLNDKILDVSNAKYLAFGTEIWEPGKDAKNSVASIASSLNYLTSAGKRATPVSITMWVLADIGTAEGRTFLQNAVEFMHESAKYTRLAFIPTNNRKTVFSKKISNAIVENDLKELRKVLKDTSINEENDVVSTELNELDKKIELLLQTVGFPRGGFGLIVNGRLIGPLKEGEQFDLGDWSLIEKFTYDSCAKHLDNNDMDADSIMRICAALGNPGLKARNVKRFTVPNFESAHQIASRKDPNDPYWVDLVAVIDPASRHAHKMAAIVSAVQHTVGQWVKIQVVFNPPAKHSELPLKSYFRYIAGEKAGERVIFENMPKDPLFTQNLIAPDNWMVEVVRGENDLDNIRLRDLKGSVSSEYELEYLLVEGHCLEAKTGSPPRGLQFTLTPEAGGTRAAETIVMANLGYFQLKAEPGVWKLGLRPGPSKEIFSLEGQTNKQIAVQSFQSVVVKVKVKRNPGQETTSLLDSEEDSKGWFGFGGKNEADDDVINIFSLASGHLYERLLKIMMLSVLKNTKSKVKFWFLKNYLSPPFKDILPDMAKEYGFDYELVHYHWPRWLNSQREKQRIIWGYKILFLDVLFPLSLKKFVFVDADQIVRADMKELFDLDLEGNPYGYVPFCDSRTEMEGFRFWKQGYWKSHLGKRKYHISALYVVDLVRFRRIAAGDRLRGQYQALSQDPNSLSNLDQDLPNNMIHQVGIKSLPQEWLWCETWCDEGSKAQAKTIDLCNNPQTKEPKLDAAQRIAAEWKLYDQELREFQSRVRTKRKEHDEL